MGLLTVSQHCLDLSSGSEPHSFRREDRLKVCGFYLQGLEGLAGCLLKT